MSIQVNELNIVNQVILDIRLQYEIFQSMKRINKKVRITVDIISPVRSNPTLLFKRDVRVFILFPDK